MKKTPAYCFFLIRPQTPGALYARVVTGVHKRVMQARRYISLWNSDASFWIWR